MSSKYPGGIISKTAPTPSGPYADSTAPGVWTLEQQAYWQKLGQWPTAGNVNPNAFIENLFSTYLYTGNDSSQTITNGIDLAGEGGLVWIKSRNTTYSHILSDTNRGTGKFLSSNTTDAQGTDAQDVSAFNAAGFTVGNNSRVNNSSFNYVSWTFREQAKFFDVVTYTGNGVSGRAIPHNLQSAPGFIAVKILSSADNWECYHRGVTFNSANVLWLNSSNALTTGGARFTSQPTSTDFYVGSDSGVNGSGQTYVAYLFAHNAGGFGLTGTDNVISCGSYTGDGSNGQSVSLGYEPQWLLIKRTDTANSWFLQDNMRPFSVTATEWLQPNTSNAESAGGVAYVSPTATGFTFTSGGSSAYNASGGTYIYIAIRRGPMAVPTLGTSVFEPKTWTGTGANASPIGGNFPPDLFLSANRNTTVNRSANDRLRGIGLLIPNLTNSEDTGYTNSLTSFNMTGISVGADTSAQTINYSGRTYAQYYFGRAPSFMDVVCYTGTGSATTFSHNLAVVPEMMIVKNRSSTANWMVYVQAVGNQDALYLNGNFTPGTNTWWNNTTPTASVFTVGTTAATNASGSTFVAYLFATCAGVSKVGSYTGTGAAQTINCGFTAGSRFVLIKRTDSTGDWYVWDSARGIIPSNDPYLLLNSTAAEVTGTDYVDTTSVGFDITSTAPAAINANGGTFIFLAIA